MRHRHALLAGAKNRGGSVTRSGEQIAVKDKDGNLTLQGVKILVDASEHVQVSGDRIDLN